MDGDQERFVKLDGEILNATDSSEHNSSSSSVISVVTPFKLAFTVNDNGDFKFICN